MAQGRRGRILITTSNTGFSKGFPPWTSLLMSSAVRPVEDRKHGLLLTPSPHKRAKLLLPKTEEQREEFWHTGEKIQNKKI